MAFLLEARDLHKSFPRAGSTVEVLRGCDFTLTRGEAVAVIGASGAGKSTLLNIFGGLDTPTGGVVQHDGNALRFDDHAAMAEWRSGGVGFVFQFHFLLPDFTAYENLLLPVQSRGAVTGADEERARTFLARMGLEKRADHLPGELSGGEQQRIAVARAFMNRPAIVLADEPFGNLDHQIGGELGDMLFDLRRTEGTSLVIVTHDLDLAARADRTLVLRDKILVPAEGKT